MINEKELNEYFNNIDKWKIQDEDPYIENFKIRVEIQHYLDKQHIAQYRVLKTDGNNVFVVEYRRTKFDPLEKIVLIPKSIKREGRLKKLLDGDK